MSKKKMPNKMKEWRRNGEGRSSRNTITGWQKGAMYPLLASLFARASISVSKVQA